MIQQDHIADDHPDKKGTRKRLNLSRAAADADLDRARWQRGSIAEDRFAEAAERPHELDFVPAFAIESASGYRERVSFLSSPGWTQFLVDSFVAMFDSVDKRLEIKNASAEEIDHIQNNLDGNELEIDTFASELFREGFITNRLTIPTDRSEGQMPHAFILRREFIKNWVHGGEGLEFITWDAPTVLADGISRQAIDRIVIRTLQEMAVAEFDDRMNKWRVVAETPNTFGKTMVVDEFLHDGMPLVLSTAKIEHDFMNLKSEMRKIIRDQAGMNVLEIDRRTNINKLTSTSMVKAQGGPDFVPTRWVGYPSGSMSSQFEFWDREVQIFEQMNRLRQMKRQAEAGVSKRLDFLNSEAILSTITETVEQAVEKTVKLLGLWLGKDYEVSYSVDRDFDVSDINEDLDALLKIISAGFGSTFEKISKLNFAKKWGQVGEQTLKDIESELDSINVEPLLFEEE